MSKRSWTRFVWASYKTQTARPVASAINKMMGQEREWEETGLTRTAVNNLYTVSVSIGDAVPSQLDLIYLSIKRTEKARLPRDWRDLQRIKNEILGAEFEAVELFPAESRLVDTADQFHLWAWMIPLSRHADAGEDGAWPFGYEGRMVLDDETRKDLLGESVAGSQRGFEFTPGDFHTPPLIGEAQLKAMSLRAKEVQA